MSGKLAAQNVVAKSNMVMARFRWVFGLLAGD
jgi:hypothetical protein